jgi:hypothetical protein
MARKTAAERNAEFAVAQAAAKAQRELEFPGLVWNLLLRAQKVDAKVQVAAAEEFTVTLVDMYNNTVECDIGLAPNESNEMHYDQLLWEVNRLEALYEEQNRRESLRRSAVAKLTKEEREELGL